MALELCCLTCYGQATVVIPENFVETTPPKAFSAEWRKLSSSDDYFVFKITNKKLEVKTRKEITEKEYEPEEDEYIFGVNSELKITGGTLIGRDYGEWGGKLSFQSADTTQKSIKIMKGNIRYIFTFKGKIYFINGVNYMLENLGGELYELHTANNQFTYKKILDFEGVPYVLEIYNEKFLVATSRGFYIIHNFKNETTIEDEFWPSLYPTSIAAFDDENIFIGISGGIVKIDIINKTMKFYKSIK
jgi:hypothetical protein